MQGMNESVIVIETRWREGAWVFESDTGTAEVLAAGMADVIDDLAKDIADARDGFRLLLSAMPFPDYQVELTSSGNWYKANGKEGEGWLCPPLFRCFEAAPEAIYLKAEPGHAQAASAQESAEVTALRNRVEELEKLVYRLTMENEMLKSGRSLESPPETDSGRYWETGETQGQSFSP